MQDVTKGTIESTDIAIAQLSEALAWNPLYLGPYMSTALTDILKLLHGEMALWEYRKEYALCYRGGGHFADYCRERECPGMDSSSSSDSE